MLRLLLVAPLLPCIWLWYQNRRSKMLRARSKDRLQEKGLVERCCKVRRPGARNVLPKVFSEEKPSEEGFSWYLHNYMACFIQWSCFDLKFTENLTVHEAINRYVEGPKKTWAELLDGIEKNKYLTIIIEYLSLREPKFYFRILPSGSIREGFGYPLPSTSVLASDYDLMLVPDGIFVYDEFTEREGRFPASFTAVDDPEQNPERPKGFLWLKLEEENTIKVWKQLCYERMDKKGGITPVFIQKFRKENFFLIIGNFPVRVVRHLSESRNRIKISLL